MKPDVPRVLGGVAAALGGRVMPALEDEYAQGTVGQSAMLLGLIAQEYDRAVYRLAEENRALRALFAEAIDSPAIDDPALHERLHAAAADDEHDLHVSKQQALNDRLRALLIDLHAAAERADGPDAERLEAAIWAELQESTRRRHLNVGRG